MSDSPYGVLCVWIWSYQQRVLCSAGVHSSRGQDAHGAAGSEAALLHEPFARLHQGGRELRRVHAVIPPAPDAIRNTWEENRMGKMSSLRVKPVGWVFISSTLIALTLNFWQSDETKERWWFLTRRNLQWLFIVMVMQNCYNTSDAFVQQRGCKMNILWTPWTLSN